MFNGLRLIKILKGFDRSGRRCAALAILGSQRAKTINAEGIESRKRPNYSVAVKSYILEPIASGEAVIAALNSALPYTNKTWLLKDATGDLIAYFYVDESDEIIGEAAVFADVSGRHYNRDEDVILVLPKIRQAVGGEITKAD